MEAEPQGPIPDENTLEEVISEIGVRLKKLLVSEDYLSSASLEDIQFLYWTISYGEKYAVRETICTSMYQSKIAQVFERIWNKHSNENFCDETDASSALFCIMEPMLSFMWNGTDKSADLCIDIYKNLIYKDILKYLQLPQLQLVFTEDKEGSEEHIRRTCIMTELLGVLHNVVQKVFESREALRESGAVQILQKFRGCPHVYTSTLALIVQAYIVTEDENERLNSNDKTFEFLVKLLEGCLDTPTGANSSSGFHTIEILDAINRLALNDSNKSRIVKAGALPHYVKVIQGSVVDEQRLAAEGLWTLAFKCKDDIIKEPGCVEALTKLSESSTDPDVKKKADGVLWIIRGNDQVHSTAEAASCPLGTPAILEGQPLASSPSRSESRDKADQHIFISYQWDCKDAVLQLRDKLRASGFKVWVDVDDMSGSVLEAMAAAVENAAVVLICLTNKYKESPNCRTEAEYTFRLKKSIVPLRLQDRYYPDGWLGALVGSKLVHNFTKEFDIVYPDLVRDLKSIGKGVSEHGSQSQGERSHPMDKGPSIPGQGSSGQGKNSTVEKWTKNNISEWLNRNKLNHRVDWFSEFDGSLLQEFKLMRRDAPEQFHLLLRDNNFSVIDILKLSRALKEL